MQHERVLHDSSGRAKLYADIAHPINAECREMIQRRIVEELENEQQLAREPGYRSRYDEGYDDARHVHKPHKSREGAISVCRNVDKADEQAGDKADEKAQTEKTSVTGANRDNLDGPADAKLASSPAATAKGISDNPLGAESISKAAVGSVANSQLEDATDPDDMFGKGVFDI